MVATVREAAEVVAMVARALATDFLSIPRLGKFTRKLAMESGRTPSLRFSRPGTAPLNRRKGEVYEE
jgi:hypothetical protein